MSHLIFVNDVNEEEYREEAEKYLTTFSTFVTEQVKPILNKDGGAKLSDFEGIDQNVKDQWENIKSMLSELSKKVARPNNTDPSEGEVHAHAVHLISPKYNVNWGDIEFLF